MAEGLQLSTRQYSYRQAINGGVEHFFTDNTLQSGDNHKLPTTMLCVA